MTGKIIKELRTARGLTQRELAEALSVDRSSIGKYETGTMPSGDVLLKLAEYFGVSVDYLCEREQSGEIARDADERELLVMFRKTSGISPERREQIKEYISSTIDMYLKAMGESDD